MEPYLSVQQERRAPAPGRRATDDRASLREGQIGCRVVDLPRVTDPCGNLTFVEGEEHVPFAISRVHYRYDVPGGAWRELDNFSSGSVCLVLASAHFDEADYDRDYDEFTAARRRRDGRGA